MTVGLQIVVERLVKKFGQFVAVDDVSFDVGHGEIMGFIGPNGAGKSTIIRMLCGLLRPTEGRALVSGIDVARDPERVRESIGYMSQKFSLYNDLTVAENLRFFGGIYNVPRNILGERTRSVVDMAGLVGREDAVVSTLAGGWKQRLALGCAILHRPPVLFLDEPTSGVDPLSRRRFWDLIHGLSGDGVSVLVSTHYMDEAEYCNRVALIDRGKLIALGTPGELKHRTLGGKLLFIACDDIGAAIELLQAAPGVRDVAAFGNALHVLVGNEGGEDSRLRDWLTVHGMGRAHVSEIEPTLEDAFVHLVGGHGTGSGAMK